MGVQDAFQCVGDKGRIQIGVRAQNVFAVNVRVATIGGAFPIVKFFAQLRFEQGAFFFHHQNMFQTGGEIADIRFFQRPHHADFMQPNAEPIARRVVQPAIQKRLPRIVVRFAAGDDAEAVVRRGNHVVIQTVRPQIRQHRRPFLG